MEFKGVVAEMDDFCTILMAEVLKYRAVLAQKEVEIKQLGKNEFSEKNSSIPLQNLLLASPEDTGICKDAHKMKLDELLEVCFTRIKNSKFWKSRKLKVRNKIQR